MPTSLIWHSERPAVTGWRHLWAKHVTGFVPSRHCAGCLKGSYEERFGRDMRVNDMIWLDRSPGDIIYFCGVSTPYDWANNLHLAVRVTGKTQDLARLETYTGDELTVVGAAAIPFDNTTARLRYPDRGREFLTCRNFQFAASQFAAQACA